LAAFFIAAGEYATRAYSKIYISLFSDINSSVSGVVTESYIDRVRRGIVRPHVYYEYFVDGHKYSNNVVSLHDYLGIQKETVEKYKPGMKVLVHYDQSDPGFSVLEKSVITITVVIQAVAGLVLAVLSFTIKW
jgi:hypothetical protein